MHLRRLIVLITNARNIISQPRSCNRIALRHRAGFLRKGRSPCMIRKKTNYHVARLFLPEGVGSNETKGDLFTMSKYPAVDRFRSQHSQTLLFSHTSLSTSAITEPKQTKKLVEPDGIEPTTSCLQSRRSPS